MKASDIIREEHDNSHLGPYDSGSADSYYGRRYDPHKYVDQPDGSRKRVKLTDPKEIAAYKAGYSQETGRKDYGEAVEEAWSAKYKRSIDCSHPKGFSQKAHCAGRKKKTEEQQLAEKCWTGYHQDGTKKKSGRMVPNCVKNEAEAEPVAETCPHCGGIMYEASMMTEKKDACYYKVKSRYKVWPSAYASGALVKCRKKGAKNWGSKSESTELPENPYMNEDLHKWFKEKWVRFGPDGKIRGDCARGSDKEGKPKCLPQSKAHALGKKGRASAAARKRRQDPDPDRRGKAHNVATRKESVSMAEAANAAQQAAIAIAKKKSGKYRKDGKRIREDDDLNQVMNSRNRMNAATDPAEKSRLQQQHNAVLSTFDRMPPASFPANNKL
jgi:Family of unknown function (DUF5872)